MKSSRKIVLALVVALSLLTMSPMSSQAQVNVSVQYINPSWAPPYYAGVRYYYLPDIEVYYDLTDGDFVYLQDGQWVFSPTLPPMYSDYDLNDAFVVALNVNVYKPWLHYSYYLSHYPRYYYLNFYGKENVHDIRGFNENAKKPFYWDARRARVNATRTAILGAPKLGTKPPEECIMKEEILDGR